MHLLEFLVDDQRHAMLVDSAESVFLAVEITPLADAPEAVLGLVNVHGRILPAVSLRKRLGLPDKPPQPGDRMILANSGERSAVLLVDAVTGVLDLDEDKFVTRKALFPEKDIPGSVADHDGVLLLVEDLESVFRSDTEAYLSLIQEGPPAQGDDARDPNRDAEASDVS